MELKLITKNMIQMKLYTTSFIHLAMMLWLPSDYMVQKLVEEDRLLELNYDRLTIDTDNFPKSGATIKDNEEKQQLADSLVKVMNESTVHPKENVEKDREENGIYPSTGSILDYAVPYFWGDLVVVVNPTPNNIQFLKEHNMELELDGEGKPTAQATSKGGVNLESPSDVDAAVPRIEELIKPKNVSLNGDDLITKVAEGLFDFALMYNGDAAYANMVYNHEDDDDDTNDGDTKFIYGRPAKENTNIFSDNMVIAKKNRNVELSYAFVNFITAHSAEISEYVGVASPIQSAMNELVAEGGTYEDYKDLYEPTNTGMGQAFTYNHEVDDYLVDKYNSIIAGKN
ncbi:hypothetical protein FQA39_LY12863 [Lamprigera yunnana]|nr:hypothetical protein FQA39_LY12863 [Lamprigera yunnana]